ncbi:hypothetical protein niasHT_023080 [Heterodera trifolii]|uniref:Uncharacterized protein n=1 Tax=Heterodera trifolii TaxID=157864 RepID=A0ABD2KFX3_9BILA
MPEDQRRRNIGNVDHIFGNISDHTLWGFAGVQKSGREKFLRRKLRIILDLLKPKAVVIRDEAMEKQFNRRHGAKPRSFAVGDRILARHRLSQPWRPGKITKCKGVIYYVEFLDGKFGLFHANQLLFVRSTDEIGTDALKVFNDAFDLPLAPPLVPHGGQVQLPVVAPAVSLHQPWTNNPSWRKLIQRQKCLINHDRNANGDRLIATPHHERTDQTDESNGRIRRTDHWKSRGKDFIRGKMLGSVLFCPLIII